MDFSFRKFVEETEHKPANYIDTIWQELGIDRNALPDTISTGWLELPEEGLTFNQAIWQVVKPIDEHDLYVRIRYFKANSASPNFVRAYMKKPDGSLEPYQGKIEGTVHLITVQKLAQILGLPLSGAIPQQGVM